MDNSTGEIYAAINHILKGIGFSEKQIEHQQKKIVTDELFRNHTQKFSGVDLNLPAINEIWCISNRKLPLALAKINLTPKMKKEQPDLCKRLLTYQDKCADVLSSVFIDKKTINDINTELLVKSISNAMSGILNPVLDKISHLEKQNKEQPISQIEPSYKKPYNPWFAKMQPKYRLLEEYFGITRGII